MSQTALLDRQRTRDLTSESDGREFEDHSPFGLQGLTRDVLQIVRPEFITQLAITLALKGTRAQIRDPEFVKRQLSYHPEWVDEYQVVHLIEKSLWIQGRSDLVMTLTRNPTQIPDNPPPKIMEALARAYTLHPESTVWYGVPLFGAEKNSDGLPIPVSASQVRNEAERRIKVAQQHALRWGWFYLAMLGIGRIPARCVQAWRIADAFVRGISVGVARYWKTAREDARRRARAEFQQQLEHCRFGCVKTELPEHRTWLGRGIDSAGAMMEFQVAFVGHLAPFIGTAAPLAIAKFAPMLLVPMTVVSVDPFLFVELPEEPGKLRHVGHWYWQQKEDGEKLHLHV